MLTACIHTNFSGCQYENWSDIPCLPIDAGPGLVCCDSIYRGSKKEGGEAEVRILPGKSVRITTKGDGSGWRTSTLLSGIFIIGLTFFGWEAGRPLSSPACCCCCTRVRVGVSTEIIFALLVHIGRKSDGRTTLRAALKVRANVECLSTLQIVSPISLTHYVSHCGPNS